MNYLNHNNTTQKFVDTLNDEEYSYYLAYGTHRIDVPDRTELLDNDTD